MLGPKNNPLVRVFFDRYIRYIISRNFALLKISPIKTDPEKPVLLLANHYSWWDGFILWEVNKLFLHRNFHVMVRQKTLAKEAFMRSLGAFSVPESGTGLLASMRFAATLLKKPQNMVLIFPQGKIHSNFVTEVAFKKGIWEIAQMANHDFQYVFAAVFTETLQHKKPSVFIEMEAHPACSFGSAAELEKAYNAHYTSALKKQRQNQV